MKCGPLADKNKWKGSGFTIRVTRTYHKFLLKKKKNENVCTYCTFPLMPPVTLATNVSLRPIYFKRGTGNSSKYSTNQKSLGDCAVTCHEDKSASHRWCLPATALESFSSQTKCTLGIITTQISKCAHAAMNADRFLPETGRSCRELLPGWFVK